LWPPPGSTNDPRSIIPRRRYRPGGHERRSQAQPKAISDRGIVMSVLSNRQSKCLARSGARARTPRCLVAAVLAAGALAAIAAPSAVAKTVSLKCRGGSSSCSVTIGLAGGASNKKLKIALTDTNLKLVGRSVKPKEVKGAYSLSKGSYSLGGSVYNVTLNAVQSIPKGATLTLRFAVPQKRGTPGQ
jgi:hypothetical protein